MDAFAFIIGLTLAIAGLFLYKDYTKFLRGAYSKHGKVVSIQQIFTNKLYSDSPLRNSSFVKNGFYPVIEYALNDEAVQFTAIDHLNSGNFHVGDEVKLKIIKTRRKQNRPCNTAIALTSMILILSLGLVCTGIISTTALSIGQIFLASCVIAICLSILVVYFRGQDDHVVQDLSQTRSGRTQICLSEPTAFRNWNSALRDPIQRNKIRSSKFCGATCMCSAFLMLVFAIQPLATLFISIS
mgnify:CR=1 FL=1